MIIDRQHVIETFDAYAHQYNLDDTKIKLKYDHTYRVAAFCVQIAKSLNLSDADVDLAWVLGMFHDIGRFEQVRRYGTFKDRESVNHAELSADILFVDGEVRHYLTAAPEELDLMEKAVRFHNRYMLPEDLSAREALFCNILRDADKIDILRVNCETSREEIYDLPAEAFLDSAMSEEVYQSMLRRQMIDRKYSKTGIDFIMGHIAFVYGLVFDESKRMVQEQGYLQQLLEFTSRNQQTQARIVQIRQVVNLYLHNEQAQIQHPFPPLYDSESRILILGSFPSVKSREQRFFYGHKQNRFWKVLASILACDVPETIADKQAMLHKHHIALWDVIASCTIEGSADSSIKHVVPNDLTEILAHAQIKAIYTNGNKSYELYQKYIYPILGREAIKLPSTSPANAAYSVDRLVEQWKQIADV